MKTLAIVASAALMIGAMAAPTGTAWAGEYAAKARSNTSASEPRDYGGTSSPSNGDTEDASSTLR